MRLELNRQLIVPKFSLATTTLEVIIHVKWSEVTQSCPTLCDPMDCSLPGSTVHGVFQARVLEWVAISFSNAWKWKMKVKLLSRVWLLATPWTAAYQAPPSMGFSRQEYWSGVPLPSPFHSKGGTKTQGNTPGSKGRVDSKHICILPVCSLAQLSPILPDVGRDSRRMIKNYSLSLVSGISPCTWCWETERVKKQKSDNDQSPVSLNILPMDRNIIEFAIRKHYL